jgi:hypothetical protein
LESKETVKTSKGGDISETRREIMGAASSPRLAKMMQPSWLFLVGLILMSPAVAVAGPAEEANAVVDRFSAAYTSNDPEAVVKL